MADDVEVTERGEIVAHGEDGDVWVYRTSGDAWWVCVEVDDTRLTAGQLAAWCRRVLREVDPDPAPTVDESAIRADERAKVEADVLAWVDVQMRHVRTVPGASFVWRSGGAEALGELADDIRAGKHRRTA